MGLLFLVITFLLAYLLKTLNMFNIPTFFQAKQSCCFNRSCLISPIVIRKLVKA